MNKVLHCKTVKVKRQLLLILPRSAKSAITALLLRRPGKTRGYPACFRLQARRNNYKLINIKPTAAG